MSADEVQQDSELPKRNKDWVQDYQVWLVKTVYDLAKAGVFKGHACAQAVLTYYRFNTAIYDSEPRGFRRGYVMPGCTYPASVAKATSFTPKAVREANIWLHQQRLINYEDNGATIDSTILDETERLKVLAEQGPREAPKLKAGPRFRKPRQPAEAEIEHEDQVIEPQVRSIRTSGAITEGPNRTSGCTYSSDSSSLYNSDKDTAEPPAAACRESNKSLREEEEEEGSAAPRPAGAEAGGEALAYILGRNHPDDGLHWFVDLDDDRYRPAVGRSRPKPGEIPFEGTQADLLATYPALAGRSESTNDHSTTWIRPDKDTSPARNQPQSGGHDNHFWMGVSKAGDPYFTRTSDRPCRKGERQVKLTADEARQLMTLKGAEHLEHRQTLHDKYHRRAA